MDRRSEAESHPCPGEAGVHLEIHARTLRSDKVTDSKTSRNQRTMDSLNVKEQPRRSMIFESL